MSILFLLVLVILYSYRLIYYYRLEHKPKVKENTLNNTLTDEKNLVTSGDGLYQMGDGYVFKGKNINNYLLYSGRLWRIVSINADGSIKLITNDIQTSMVWSFNDNNYENSYIRDWLNVTPEKEHTGIFYNSLSNPSKYLVAGKWCLDIIEDVNKTSCDKINEEDKVGLLSIEDYKLSGGSNGYLNNNSYEWTINGYDSNQVWYRLPSGDLSNNSNKVDSYYSYGVRPVINIKGTLKPIDGDGSTSKPFIIEDNTKVSFANVVAGQYISYSGYNWRVIDKNEKGIKVAMDGYILDYDDDPVLKAFSTNSNIFDIKNSSNIGYYLNHSFYNSLTNSNYIISGDFNVAEYNSDVNYDYKNIYTKTVNAKVGLMSVADLFMNDFDSFATLTSSNELDNTIYTALEDGKLYANLIDMELKIRPVVYLDITLRIIGGTGMRDNPFIVSR